VGYYRTTEASSVIIFTDTIINIYTYILCTLYIILFIGYHYRSRDHVNTVELGYNDIGLSDILSTTLDILWYKLMPRC